MKCFAAGDLDNGQRARKTQDQSQIVTSGRKKKHRKKKKSRTTDRARTPDEIGCPP